METQDSYLMTKLRDPSGWDADLDPLLIKKLRLLAQIDTYGMGEFYLGQVALAREILNQNGLAWSKPLVMGSKVTRLFARSEYETTK